MKEENPQDRRRYPRLNTGPEYGLYLWVGDHRVEHARMQNISACGLALQMQVEEAGTLEVGSTVAPLYLDHPDLPWVPLQATVMWVLGKHAGKTSGYILVGLDFTLITPFVRNLIQEHVLNQRL